jgi:Ca2+/Na+ antiporter
MLILLVGAIAIVALVVLGVLVVASLKRTNQQGADTRSFGQPGWFTYIMSLKRAGLALLCLVPLYLVWVLFQGSMGRSSLPIGMLVLMAVCVIAFKLVQKRSDQAERGADAEVAVAHLLRTLPKEYYVFHDLGFEGFNIDHVVIGPTGVFTVETKSHRGKVSAGGETLRLNGRPFEKPILNQAWSEAFSLRDRLPQIAEKPCPVQPILCFPNAFIEVRGRVKGVIVTNRQFLLRVVTGRRAATLSQLEILQLVKALKLSTSSVPLGRV